MLILYAMKITFTENFALHTNLHITWLHSDDYKVFRGFQYDKDISSSSYRDGDKD